MLDFKQFLRGTHARDFHFAFVTFFQLHSIIDRAVAQNFLNNKSKIYFSPQIFENIMLLPKTHRITPHFQIKRLVSLCVFFVTLVSTSSLNTLYTVLPKVHSFTLCFFRKTLSFTLRYRQRLLVLLCI